jgi:hypothetical protein
MMMGGRGPLARNFPEQLGVGAVHGSQQCLHVDDGDEANLGHEDERDRCRLEIGHDKASIMLKCPLEPTCLPPGDFSLDAGR